MTYLARLVERATGASTPSLVRAQRPDPGGSLDEVESIVEVAAPIARVAPPSERTMHREVRSQETTIVERSLQPVVEHSVSIVPASPSELRPEVPPPPMQPQLQPQTELIERVVVPIVEHDVVQMSTQSEPVESIMIEHHHERERVEQLPSPPQIVREIVGANATPPPIIEARSAPTAVVLPTPLAIPSVAPAPIAPVDAPPREPRLVIGKLTVEVVQPQQPIQAPQQTIVVQRAAPAPRTSVLLRNFGLDQG